MGAGREQQGLVPMLTVNRVQCRQTPAGQFGWPVQFPERDQRQQLPDQAPYSDLPRLFSTYFTQPMPERFAAGLLVASGAAKLNSPVPHTAIPHPKYGSDWPSFRRQTTGSIVPPWTRDLS